MSVIDSSYRPRRIHKLLVANRGEIALRVIRAARELGMRSVAVYSDADHDALATRMADEAVHIGPAHATRSYLNVDAVLKAARETGAQAVHPGYGFLSENAAFAQAVSDAGLIFVGPDAETIRKMGDKAAARACAQAAGVPTVPGSAGVVSSLDEALTHAGGMGYPLMIKAAAGGGGRGIRVVQDEAELRAQMPQAQAEAQAAFGYGGVYLERYLPRARHIEVQVLGDGKNAIHLYERECSLQRRRQKVFEEAPSPALDAATRQRLCESAAQLARSVGYRGAGTLEFLYDDSRGAQDFYFIEMNTRIQVEHPITEAVTGVDLVREMLRIADGEPLRWRQQDISLRGAAIECRLNAEDPQRNFAPSPAASISCAGRADRECAWIPCCIRAARYRPTTIRCWPSSLSGTKTVARRWPGWRGRWTRSSWKASIPRWRCTARWRRIPRWWRATTTRTGWKPGCGRSGRSSDERALHPWRRRIHLRRDQRGHVAGILLQGHGHHPRCASARSTA